MTETYEDDDIVDRLEYAALFDGDMTTQKDAARYIRKLRRELKKYACSCDLHCERVSMCGNSARKILKEKEMLGDVIDQVIDEVKRAQDIHPKWPSDPMHALAIVSEEYGEFAKAVLQTTYEFPKSTADDIEEEAIQMAAMAVRFLLSMDKYNYKEGKQHAQMA